MGAERTQNPSLAATALLKRGLGKGKFKRAVHGLRRRRRSFHRGNPLPAALIAGVASKIPGLKSILKTGSEKRAGGVAGQLVSAAVNGNLTAAKAIMERTMIGIMKERAVWKRAAAQIPPNILELVNKYAEEIPGVDHSTPESAANDALSRPVDGLKLEKAARDAAEEAAAAQRSKRESAAAARAAAAERREARITELGAAGLSALAGRSRRPARRRKKRRTTGRRVSL